MHDAVLSPTTPFRQPQRANAEPPSPWTDLPDALFAEVVQRLEPQDVRCGTHSDYSGRV